MATVGKLWTVLGVIFAIGIAAWAVKYFQAR
jgi:hypothetical protein